MNARWWIAILVVAAGLALWQGVRPRPDGEAATDIDPSALFAASFADPGGNPRTLAQFAGKVVVLNFWATWCAPCREEMPAFVRAQRRWAERGVQFVGLANEDPRRVERFAKDMGVDYPLWVGGESVSELSRRLGNRQGGLPYTVILSATGVPMRRKVGAYSEPELEATLKSLIAK